MPAEVRLTDLDRINQLKKILGYEVSRSRQAPFPFTKNVTVDLIAAAGDKLWKELVGDASQPGAPAMKVTTVSLAFTGIEVSELGQQSIAEFFRSDSSVSTPTTFKIKRPREDDHNANEKAEEDSTSFMCLRCGKRIAIKRQVSSVDESALLLSNLKQEHDDFHFAQDLAKESGGSSSYTSRPRRSESPPPPKKQKSKKKRKDPPSKGIEQFFRPKS